MKIDFIPFQIGEQYENWEFDLEPVYSEVMYDKYFYYKNDITTMLGIPVKSIYLAFSLDILFQVEYHFYPAFSTELITKLFENLSTGLFKAKEDRIEWENTKSCVVLEIPNETDEMILRVIDKFYIEDL